jgi:hypothetical protein
MLQLLQNLDIERLRVLFPYLVIGLATFGLYCVYVNIFPPTALQKLTGPPGAHFLMGNLLETFKCESGSAHKKWANEYGHVVAYKGFFNVSRRFHSAVPFIPT